ncbi:MAG: ribosome biogenesis GTPase YlqF [Herbinix sp.]|nr:ribosome biogenesis GTPase YlqF [Herbinix sp.]
MNFQWYPGHMAKAKRMMQEDIKLIDVVIELVDARIPYSSKNPDIDVLAKNKSRVILLNKCDMSDQRYNTAWKEYFEAKGYFVALVNSKSGSGVKQVQDIVNKACEAKIERDRRKGILNRPVRAMIVGIPNVGKSTFINSFVGKASTKTGNKPGVTKGKQWIRLSKFTELLDTPGILWPKFEDQSVGLRLALIGSINDNIIDTTNLSLELIMILKKHYPEVLTNRYGIEKVEVEDNLKGASKVLEKIALKRSCLLKGGEPDMDRAANMIIDDFRSIKLGNITLEFPSDMKDKAEVSKSNKKEIKVNTENVKTDIIEVEEKTEDVKTVEA